MRYTISAILDMSNSPKKVFISIDMEGTSGIVDWTQVGRDKDEYAIGRKLMVGDLNAAVEGALKAGAEEIVVSDAHGVMRNLQPEEVHEAAYLIRGSPKPLSMMEGISDEFDAALYVAYHSMNGTENGVLAHTISGSVVDAVFVNGRETGEFGMNAALAGWCGVPSVFVSGDAAVAAECRSFVPKIHVAIIKWGVGRYAARCMHPRPARALITKTVAEALADYDKIDPYVVQEPVEVKLKCVTSTQADAASVLPYAERVDGRMIKSIFSNYNQALKGLRAAITLSGTAEAR